MLGDPDIAARPPAPGRPAAPSPVAAGVRPSGPVTLLALGIVLTSSLWGVTGASLWIDEAISLGATNQLRQTIAGTGGTMALYYVLLDGWTAAFGPSRLALRSLSVVFLLAAVAVLAGLLRRLLRPGEATPALLVVAALPVVSALGRDARAYSLVLLVTVSCWATLARAVEADAAGDARSARRWGLALAPLAAAGVLSHGLFVLQLPALVLSVAVHLRRRSLVAALAPAGAAAGAALAGLLAIGASDVGDWIPPLSRAQAHEVATYFLTPRPGVALVLAGLAAVGAGTLVARTGADRVDRWRALVPVWWALTPLGLLVALSTVRPTLLGRYVSASAPALGVLVAVGLVAVGRAVGPPHRPAAGPRRRAVDRGRRLLGLGAVGVLAAALVAGRIAPADAVFEDWDAVTAYLAREARSGDGLVFPHPTTGQTHKDTVRPPFEAAWSHRAGPRPALVTLSPARPLGEVRRFDTHADPATLSAAMVGHQRVWAVYFPHFGSSLRRALEVEPAKSRMVAHRAVSFNGGMRVILVERT